MWGGLGFYTHIFKLLHCLDHFYFDEMSKIFNTNFVESTRFGDYFGRKKPGIKKSTSLPVIQAQHAPGTQVHLDRVQWYICNTLYNVHVEYRW